MELLHLIRLGILKEKPYLTNEFTATYDGLLCNGNLVSTFGGGVGSLLRQAVGRNTVRGYIIDPITQIINIDKKAITDDKENVKPGISKLLLKYGLSEKEFANLPFSIDLMSRILDNEFVKAVIDFQRYCIRDTVEEDKKYIDYAQDSGASLTAFDPMLIIAPYVFLDRNKEASRLLRINEDLYTMSKKYEEENLVSYLMIHQDLFLNDSFVQTLISTYKNLHPQMLFLWITRLDEHEPIQRRGGINRLEKIYTFVDELTKSGIKIVRVYSSIFPFTLKNPLITGNSHGPGYGEYRGEVPVGGGLPTAKFYLPMLFRRIDYTDFESYIRDNVKDAAEYYRLICDCPTCRSTIGDDIDNIEKYGDVKQTEVIRTDPRTQKIRRTVVEYATSNAIRLSTEHYMYTKDKEMRAMEKLSKEEIRQNLIAKYKHFLDTRLAAFAEHLNIWANINI